MRVLGALLILVVLSLMIFLGGSASLFINVPSFIIVVGGTFSTLLFTHGSQGWKLFLRHLSFKLHTPNTEDVNELSNFLQAGSRGAIAWGILGQIIGLVQMLAQLDDPCSIGPSMAVSMLTIVYGIILSELLFVPLNNNLKKEDSSKLVRNTPLLGLILGVLVTNLLISKVFLLMFSFPQVS